MPGVWRGWRPQYQLVAAPILHIFAFRRQAVACRGGLRTCSVVRCRDSVWRGDKKITRCFKLAGGGQSRPRMGDRQAERHGHHRRGVREVPERPGGQKAQGGTASQITAGRESLGAARRSPPCDKCRVKTSGGSGNRGRSRDHDGEAARNSPTTFQILGRIGMELSVQSLPPALHKFLEIACLWIWALP